MPNDNMIKEMSHSLGNNQGLHAPRCALLHCDVGATCILANLADALMCGIGWVVRGRLSKTLVAYKSRLGLDGSSCVILELPLQSFLILTGSIENAHHMFKTFNLSIQTSNTIAGRAIAYGNIYRASRIHKYD
jgi:hypothetical protein